MNATLSAHAPGAQLEAREFIAGEQGATEGTLEFVNAVRPLDEHVSMLLDFSESLEFSDVLLVTDADIAIRVPSGWKMTGYGPIESNALLRFAQALRDTDALHNPALLAPPMPAANDADANAWAARAPRNQLSVRIGKWRVRVTIFTTNAGATTKMMIRKLPYDVPQLSTLGLGVLVQQLVDAQRGLVVVSGPTGAGKSTTMAAILQAKLNQDPIHAVTIEQPIEYQFKPGKGIVSQREVGADVASFEQGLNEVLRQTPDAILIGEVRTREEAEVALRAAEHGRFVIMSTHGRDGISALQKLLSFFPADEQASKAIVLSNHLVCTIHQALVPSIDQARWELAYEAFFMGESAEVAQLVSEPAKYGLLRQRLAAGEFKGSTAMSRVLAKLVRDGRIAREVALSAATDVEGLKKLMAEKA